MRRTEDCHLVRPPTIVRPGQKMGFTGLETTIIDYTLSRAEMEESEEDGHGKRIAWYDLERDEAVFEGNAEEDYQYDIYRQ